MQPARDFSWMAFPSEVGGYFMLSGSGFSLASDKVDPVGMDWLHPR